MKKQVSIPEMNKAIAEFMLYGKNNRIEKWLFETKKMEWHSSWDWLMRAVEKIESLTTEDGRGEVNYIVSIEPGYCVISVGGEAPVVEVQDHDLVKITIVHQAVYDFITYYNSEKDETR